MEKYLIYSVTVKCSVHVSVTNYFTISRFERKIAGKQLSYQLRTVTITLVENLLNEISLQHERLQKHFLRDGQSQIFILY